MEKQNVEFSKSIVKYFMDFIETDFHMRKAPKRKIVYTNSDNLVVGCNLKKYKKMEDKLSNLLNKNISSFSITVKKSDYVSTMKEATLSKILDLVENSCGTRTKDLAKIFYSDFEKKLKNKNMSEKAIMDEVTDNLTKLLETMVVEKFVDDNFEYLISKGIQEQDLITIKDSITNSLMSFFKDKINEVIKKYRNSDGIDSKQKLNFININIVKQVIQSFFVDFNVADLFLELVKMNSSKKLVDKQEFYFSFFDITYNKNKYPIFYIPFSILENDDSFELTFDSQMYINKKSIEYIIQELKSTLNLNGKIDSINERIIYLTNYDNSSEIVLKIIHDIINYFSLSGEFNEKFNEKISFKNEYISISNSFYFNVFDNSDDALVNDYEELLQLLNMESESDISKIFLDIIDGFMTREPISLTDEVNKNWNDQTVSEKLVFKAPIPLNEEQIKILQALKNDKCKYVTVQGPPGTGKSHTITAIAFDMILNDKSILVLSDKKEALDVVEDKITSTLSKVRIEDNFQNPILRLGRSGNNYSQILSQESMDNIKINYRVLKNQENEINEKIEKYVNSMKSDIDFEKETFERIKLEEILEYEELESHLDEFNKKTNMKDLANNYELQNDIDKIFDLIEMVKSDHNDEIVNSLNNVMDIGISDELYSYEDLSIMLEKISKYNHCIKYIQENYNNYKEIYDKYANLSDNDYTSVTKLYNDYKAQKSKLFGFTFKKSILQNLLKNIKRIYSEFDINNYKNELSKIGTMIEINEYIFQKIADDNSIRIFKNVIYKENFDDLLKNYKLFMNAIAELKEISMKYRNNFGNLNFYNIRGIDYKYNEVSREDYKKIIRYLTLKDMIYAEFSDVTISRYMSYKKALENLITLKTTSIIDSRVLDFYENNKNNAKLLRKIIQKKQKFPKEDFIKLKNSFPCILAGIRDYAEYIPLESGLFDLIIIDEASQVSIAQALPALIRAKKVLVLGDKKQFSNVKSNQAKTDINTEYKSIIKENFKNSLFFNPAYYLKLDNFDIKSSVLDFFESISNYQTMLYKYFRGYKEIISYSNKFFYNNKLQVMKIRGKAIDEVLKFKFIEHDGKLEFTPKTNKLEVEFIISELKRLLKENYKGSVGIITPHTNQQKLLFTEVRKCPEYSEYEKIFNLKVMTFDSCQGEERDIIFYSMVANLTADSLWGIFPKDLDPNKLKFEDEGNLRAQRLNVGFSRAKECMYFVVSKPLNQFDGEIGNALRHFANILEVSRTEKDASETDSKSAMEPQVLNWFYQTKFWLEENKKIDFLPQFELGKYLKQLDPTYSHPLYCVDFLLLYTNNKKEYKIIIEYDGFREHFEELMYIDVQNYNDYYKEEDIYRQKVLESYGYKFLRINKFNVSDNPVETLNKRLYKLVNDDIFIDQTFKDKINNQINGLHNRSKKECPNCGKILDIAEFLDPMLISGTGRICKNCKNMSISNSFKSISSTNYYKCPKCGRRLIIRNGTYGKFVGCSGYPYCKYTKKL